jgi:predicted dehydrogenase
MTAIPPVSIGTVGLRNFGNFVCRMLEKHSEGPEPAVRLTAVLQRNASQHADAVARLRGKGIKVVERYEDLLAEPIEALWLPLPIHLHAGFTEQALAAGKAVMCEKPAAGSVDEVDRMIAAQRKYGLAVAIGYQDIFNPTTMQVKKLLLGGQIGQVRSITIHSAGPRGDTYYQRSAWVGRFQCDGGWVMDSIANNAHAHEINLALFLAGPSAQEAASPVSVQAELYRSNPIENFDTISMRLGLDTGADMLVVQTHGCEFFVDSVIVIEGDRGRILRTRDVVVVEEDDGRRARPARQSRVLRAPLDAREAMIRRFARAVRGMDDADIALCTPRTSRGQVVAVNGASEATGIVDIPDRVKRIVKTSQGTTHAVIGMEAMVTLCATRRTMMSESGLFDWTVAPGHKDLADYRHFAGPRDLRAVSV